MLLKETRTVIEDIGSGFRASRLSIDNKDLVIEVLGQSEAPRLEDLVNKNFSSDSVVLMLEPQRATTIENTIKIVRAEPKTPVNEAELDHLVFKSLWEFLNRYRGWASSKMSVTDSDMVLADIEVLGVSLDSHNVFDPLGFKGKNFLLKLRGTFVPRSVLPWFAKAVRLGDRFKVIERMSIASSLAVEGDFAVNYDKRSTYTFSLKNGEIRFKKRYPWGFGVLCDSVASALSVDERTAFLILGRYFNRCISKKLGSLIQTRIEKNLRALQKIIRDTSSKRDVKIFINAPPPIFHAALKEISGAKFLDFQQVLKQKGFSVNIVSGEDGAFSSNEESFVIAAQSFFSPKFDLINKMLKRRSKWLVPNL